MPCRNACKKRRLLRPWRPGFTCSCEKPLALTESRLLCVTRLDCPCELGSSSARLHVPPALAADRDASLREARTLTDPARFA